MFLKPMNKLKNQKSYFIPMQILFLLFASYTYLHATDETDWLVENILVLGFLLFLNIQFVYGSFQFNTISYICIFSFLALHEWGAQYCYSSHPYGFAMQNTYHLQRNGYDRLVHTSFGFLLYYPIREILHYKYKMQLHKIPLRIVELSLCFASIFELIEFAVANYIFPNELGKTYVGTQGDIWDAQKDIVVAVIGCGVAILLHGLYKLVNEKIIAKLQAIV
jgi:putative membrane protein